MKKFKVRTYGNQQLHNCVGNQLLWLGYALIAKGPGHYSIDISSGWVCNKKGDACDGNFVDVIPFGPNVTLDEFFQLTPDDVRGTRTLTLDGKEIPLSEESYQALKKHFGGA